MSYTIRIGEACVVDLEDDDESSGSLWVEVGEVKHPEAPTFPGDEMTGNSNDRSPSYLGWSQFLEKCGLHYMFFNKADGLMQDHPGCVSLKQRHLDQVREAKVEWVRKHPGTIPGWCVCVECRPFEKRAPAHNPNLDHVLARLQWMEYWMAWALKNCAKPALYNG